MSTYSRTMMRISSLAVVLLFAAPGWAQDQAFLALETNYPDAIVYVDSVRLGPAHWRTFAAAPGSRTLRLLAPGEAAWSIAPLTQHMNLVRGDTIHVSLAFPLYHQIASRPLGATVYWRQDGEKAQLGRTPVIHRTHDAAEGLFIVEQFGYRAQEVVPRAEVWNRYEVLLQPLYSGDMLQAKGLQTTRKRRRWIEASAAVLIVAGGVLTVHHKFKADRLNDNYQATGDPALRPRIARLDDRAAVALIGMQVGLVAFGVRFYLKK